MQPGTIVAGKYRVERIIGRGGMGVVLEATHLQLHARVALKFLSEELLGEPVAVARFQREARASAQLKGEHICRVLDFGVEGTMPYIVMELLEGTDLARLTSSRALDVATSASYIRQACLGLAEAHAAGIVHRDLKPGNLFLTRRADGSPLVKVLDFGVAKAQGPAEVGITGTSNVVGSPGFMSPEQFRSSRTVDARADIWALGVILYKLVAGCLPWNADNFAEFALAITRDPFPPLPADVPHIYQAIVGKCLEKDPAQRFTDVMQLAEALAPLAMATPAVTVQTILGPAPTPPTSSLALGPGTTVGEYRIERKIGEGGMGVVYGAIHPLIGKKAAIKVISGDLGTNPNAVERFVQEARSVNQIGHPNIVDVFAFGQLPDGRNYFVMEHLQGESLRARLTRSFVPLAEGLQIVDEIASALEAAHEKGIVHRDLKPDNVFLSAVRGNVIIVKLLDFGIAKLVDKAPGMMKTSTGMMMGTPGYLSPEQARGKDVDHRTDIYALGCMMFEIVTGRMPFMGESPMDIVLMHIETPPRPPSELRPDLPPRLDQLVVRMLDKDAANRPSLAEVRTVFAELVASGEVAIEPGSGITFRSDLARTPPSSQRNQILRQAVPTAPGRRRAAPSEMPTQLAGMPAPSDVATVIDTQPAPRKSKVPLIVFSSVVLLVGGGVVMALTTKSDPAAAPAPTPPPIDASLASPDAVVSIDAGMPIDAASPVDAGVVPDAAVPPKRIRKQGSGAREGTGSGSSTPSRPLDKNAPIDPFAD